MDGLLVMLGLAAFAAVILGPIGFFAARGMRDACALSNGRSTTSASA